MLLLCSPNTQSFDHDKLSSTLQLVKGKLSDFQKLLRYLKRIVTSAFSVRTDGCAVWSASPSFSDCVGFACLFSVILVIYLNYLPSEQRSITYFLISSLHSTKVLMS